MIPLTVNSGEYEIEVKAFGLEDSEKIEIVNFDEHNFVSEKDLDIRLEDFFEKINKSMNSEFSCQSVGLSQGVYNSFEQEEKKIEMVEMKSYSKHFLSQNIGLLIICFGIVLVSLVIILHR